MSEFKLEADERGFLRGRVLDDSESERLLSAIKGDTGKILAAMRLAGRGPGASQAARQGRLPSSAATPAGRGGVAAARARDAAGRFAASSAARSGAAQQQAAASAPRAASEAAAETRAVESIARTVEQQRRDDKASARARNQARGSDGRFGGGDGDSRIGGAASALAASGAAALQGSEQIDPFLGAVGELRGGFQAVQAAVSPLGRAASSMFGSVRGEPDSERQPTRWLKRIEKLLRKKDSSKPPQKPAAGGDGGWLSTLTSMLPAVAAIIPAAMGALATAAARVLPAALVSAIPAAAEKIASAVLDKMTSLPIVGDKAKLLLDNKWAWTPEPIKRLFGAGEKPPAPGVEASLLHASNKAGADPNLVTAIARYESRMDPTARPIGADGKPMSSAHGLGQFTDSTWANSVRAWGEKHGVAGASKFTDAQALALRDDVGLQAAMLAELTADNAGRARRITGKNDPASVYALHTLGAASGASFLRAFKANPNAPISDVLSAKEIANNKSLYGGATLADAYAALSKATAGASRTSNIGNLAQIPAMRAPSSVASPRVPDVPRLPAVPILQAPGAAPAVDVGPAPRATSAAPVVVQAPQVLPGQDVRDRGIAHIVTGGIGSMGPHR